MENDKPVKSDLKEMWYEGLDWNYVAQNRDQRRALVNVVMNFWLREMWEKHDNIADCQQFKTESVPWN
jgi:hypothetical protein